MGYIFRTSAAKHGYTKEDAIHAIENHFPPLLYDVVTNFFAEYPAVLAIGPSTKGHVLEVMYLEHPEAIVIFHCMKATNKNLKLWRKHQ